MSAPRVIEIGPPVEHHARSVIRWPVEGVGIAGLSLSPFGDCVGGGDGGVFQPVGYRASHIRADEIVGNSLTSGAQQGDTLRRSVAEAPTGKVLHRRGDGIVDVDRLFLDLPVGAGNEVRLTKQGKCPSGDAVRVAPSGDVTDRSFDRLARVLEPDQW